MKKRNAMWRRSFNKMPKLSAMKKPALALMTDAMKGAKHRAILSHSHCFEFVSTEPLTMKFTQTRHKGGMMIYATYRISLPQLEEMADDFDELNVRLLPLTWNLACLQNLQASADGTRIEKVSASAD